MRAERGERPESWAATGMGGLQRDCQPENQENIQLMWRQKKWGSSNPTVCVVSFSHSTLRIIWVLSWGSSSWHKRRSSTLLTVFFWSCSGLILRVLPELHETCWVSPSGTEISLNRRTFYKVVWAAKICLRGCRLSTVETWVISHNRPSVTRGQPHLERGVGPCGAWPGRLSRGAPTRPCETWHARPRQWLHS